MGVDGFRARTGRPPKCCSMLFVVFVCVLAVKQKVWRCGRGCHSGIGREVDVTIEQLNAVDDL